MTSVFSMRIQPSQRPVTPAIGGIPIPPLHRRPGPGEAASRRARDGADQRRGQADLEVAPDLEVDPAGREHVGGVLDRLARGEVHDLLELEHGRGAARRPARGRAARGALTSRGRTRVTAKATGTPCAISTSSTIAPASMARRSSPRAGQRRAPGAATSRITATGSPSARIVRVTVSAARRPASSPNTAAASAPIAPLPDLEVAHAQRDAAPLGERGVGLEDLEPLVERGRPHRAADVGAAALPAGDLARLLEPVERGAQRPARHAEHARELELGRQPVARPPRARGQPRAQRLLGVVHQ